jgi:hypothetical protein
MAGEIEQRIGFGHAHVQGTVRNLGDLIPASHLALFQNAEVEARSVMRHKERRHSRFIHANTDAVAGNAGLAHFAKSTANPVSIADTNLIIRKAIDCEIFAELSEDEIASPELLFPVTIGIRLIHEDRALLASVTGQVALAVAVNVKPPNQTPAPNRTLPDRGADHFPFPIDIARKANVDGQ